MLSHREVRSPRHSDAPPVVCLHGWPESSRMWQPVLEALGAAGYHALAPDLAGYGDSPPHRPATWARHREDFEAWRAELGLDRVTLVVHDWGGLIGLRWACDHPEAVAGLVVSDTGFFADGKWHGMAQVLRTPGDGERLLEQLTADGFAGLMRSVAPGMREEDIAAYWLPFTTEKGRAAQLELYRSGEFGELGPYAGRLAALGVPTLLLWGEDDPFAPLAGAHRLLSELPHATLEVVPGTGHFVVDDAPETYAAALVRFLTRTTRAN